MTLFLLPPALLSCLLHFLLSADTGGRDSRRGGAAVKPHPPEMLGVVAKPTMGLGVAGSGQAHTRRNCRHTPRQRL